MSKPVISFYFLSSLLLSFYFKTIKNIGKYVLFIFITFDYKNSTSYPYLINKIIKLRLCNIVETIK